MSKYPKLVCFDWDGTLIDSFDNIVKGMISAGRTLDLPKTTPAKVKRKIGLSFEDFVADIYGADTSIENLLRVYNNDYHKLPLAPLFPNVKYVLESLQHAEIQVAIVTNKSRYSLELELKQHGLANFIDSIWVAEEYSAKPSPVMLRHAMLAHQAMPQEVWMVGDALPDMYAGYSAQCARIILVAEQPVPNWIENVTVIDDVQLILKLLRVEQHT